MDLCIEKEMTSGNNSVGICSGRYLRIRRLLGGCDPAFIV